MAQTFRESTAIVADSARREFGLHPGSPN